MPMIKNCVIYVIYFVGDIAITWLSNLVHKVERKLT